MARMASGRLFQRLGAALEHTFSPCVRSLHRGTKDSIAIISLVEPPAGGRPRSVVHGSVRNELVGWLCMMQPVRERVETSTIIFFTRSAV